MTRRSMLAASAGALAGGLLGRGEALAALAGPASARRALQPALFWRPLGRLAGGPRGATVDLRANADLLGVSFRGDASAQVQLRFAAAGGGWSAWVSAGPSGHGPDGVPRSLTTTGEPVWTGGCVTAQVRADRALSDVRIACVDVSGGAGARRRALGAVGHAAALALASPTLGAGPGQPPIIARSAWAQGMARPRVAPQYGAVRMAFVHHTENPNGYSAGEVPAMLRAIFVFHRYARGWNDIGYNFVVDLYGRIFEARAGGIDEPVVGAQAGGYQHGKHRRGRARRIHGERYIPRGGAGAGAAAGVEALAARRAVAGARDRAREPGRRRLQPLPGRRARVAAARGRASRRRQHRLSGQRPLCPAARAAPARQRARRAPRAAHAGAGGSAPVSGAPAAPPPSPGGSPFALGGRLAFLDGAPIAGASVLVQARSVARRGELVSEQTIASAVSDAGGTWSATVARMPRAGATWLRARAPGAATAAPGPSSRRRCASPARSSRRRQPLRPLRQQPCLVRREAALGLGGDEQRRRRA